MIGLPRVLQDGTIIYPHRGSQLPPCLEGYHRKAEQGPDSWILIPDWRLCRFRTYISQHRPDCNCEILVPICSHPTCNQIELSVSRCESCILCRTN